MVEHRSGFPVLPFSDQGAFDEWLAAQPSETPGLWLKFAKKGHGIVSVSRADALDAALCNGWIDGQIDKFDSTFWLIRYTPRRPRSKWSEVNRARALRLKAQGGTRPAGLAQIEAAKADGRWDVAYAPASTATVPDDLQSALDANPKAAEFFKTLNGPNRYAILYRIGTGKREETRARKIVASVTIAISTANDESRPPLIRFHSSVS